MRIAASTTLTLVCCAAALAAAGTSSAKRADTKDPVEPARAALRMLQFDKTISLLEAAVKSGNADAEYLLGLMYLNGVGVAADSTRARSLLQTAAEHGHGAAAYVIAAEIAHDPAATTEAAANSSRQWLERSAKTGYFRASEAIRSGRPLLDRESVGAAEPALFTPWVIDCARKNDAAELRRLGAASASAHDEFGRSSLSNAVAAGSLAAATALLELGADSRVADQAGTTALMLAAARGDPLMVTLLLQHQADVQAADKEQRTALFYAARANRAALVGPLRNAGALLDARDSRGYNALDAALVVGAEDAAAELRALGLHANRVTNDPARQSGKFDAAHPGEIYRGWPPLALAVSRNDAPAVQQLLQTARDANLRLPQGDTLLHVAADAHALQCIPLLLARGADAAAANHAGHSVLWLAAARNDLAVIKVLLSAGVSADTHASAERTPLLAALGATNSEAAQILLDAGANVDATDSRKRTPLMLAGAGAKTDLVKSLIEHRAKIDAEDEDHRTALLYAAA